MLLDCLIPFNSSISPVRLVFGCVLSRESGKPKNERIKFSYLEKGECGFIFERREKGGKTIVSPVRTWKSWRGDKLRTSDANLHKWRRKRNVTRLEQRSSEAAHFLHTLYSTLHKQGLPNTARTGIEAARDWLA